MATAARHVRLCYSKMVVIRQTHAPVAELGAHGITVNAILPGLTRDAGSAANLLAEAFGSGRARQFVSHPEVPDDLTGTLATLQEWARALRSVAGRW
ncbi:NAD(P)-dependent dehydrogenase (short-subunit alcohol dehydrogenase family) [Paraburkholderia phenoliruptrix]|uniref:hypothetical protein n=1 Tax=Paraburkholderia phenoliruptrix TaxID=252970 RepID=UPI002859C34E|nr:hypothetical protein [Paraburkholderia phenoliruptrix]MDR6422623.1 NAD(P)-dependent dehydrogenase (short-subunit alcohol dehydrogenase family) [Paraburkholderia phenoliruptrix]